MIRIPASLVVLIREQLCGSNPDLHQQHLARDGFETRHLRRGYTFSEQVNKSRFASWPLRLV